MPRPLGGCWPEATHPARRFRLSGVYRAALQAIRQPRGIHPRSRQQVRQAGDPVSPPSAARKRPGDNVHPSLWGSSGAEVRQ